MKNFSKLGGSTGESSLPREKEIYLIVATQPAITCSKLTIKTPERRQWRRSGVFIGNLEHILHLFLVFLL